ncbi:MAG: CubicO group peptidase (beta-lactamase class C family) [Arenicella sp.]|jgi:CubicO group peptidase (beta-lactamase class C family)
MKVITLLSTVALTIQLSAQNTDKIEAFVDSLIESQLDSNAFAGTSILVNYKGETILQKGYGLASVELDAPINEKSTFEIGSVTKQFTAVSILKLVETGKLSLEDNFNKYLKFDTKGFEIPIYRLLNHTSGIKSYTSIPEFWDLSKSDYDRDTLVRLIETKPFGFAPGEELSYNNSAYFFLGLIIEEVSGQSYETFVDSAIFRPLGMDNSYYCSNSIIRKNEVYGYKHNGEELMKTPFLNHIWPFSGGSLCSNTGDMLKWLQALHHGKVLNEEYYKLLTTPGKLNNGWELRYAMGLEHSNYSGHERLGHGGATLGFLSETRYFPKDELYIICLMNTTGGYGPGEIADAITWQLLDEVEPESVKVDVKSKDIDGRYIHLFDTDTFAYDLSLVNNQLLMHSINWDFTDTISIYLGDNTWYIDNDFVKVKDGTYQIDNVYGNYIFKRED